MKRSLFVFLFLLIPSVALADQVKVQVVIEDKVNGIPFRDAIYYNGWIDYTLKSVDGTLANERKSRVDNFKYTLDHPVIQPEPTEADLIATKQALIDQKASLDAQIVSLDSKIAVASVDVATTDIIA